MKHTKVLLRTVLLMITVEPGRLVTALLLTVVAALLPAVSLAILSWSLQVLTERAGSGSAAWSGEATAAALALAGASTLTFLLAVGQRYVETLFQLRLRNTITDGVLAKALTLELRHFEDAEVYDSLQRATARAGARPYQIFAALLATVAGAVTVGSVAALLLSWSPLAAALMVLSPVPLAIAQVLHHKARWRVEYARSADERRLMYLEHLVTNDQAYKEVRLLGLGPMFRRRYAAIVDGFYRVDRRLERRYALACTLFALCGAVAVGMAVMLVVGDAVRTGQVGKFAGYVTSVVLIQTSTRSFFEGVAKLYDGALQLRNLFEFLDIPVRQPRPAEARFPGRLRKGIEFRDVSFTYPGTSAPVLDRLNLFLPAGRCVALVGANGAGKSTIVKLLARFYEPNAGDILIDDLPIAAYDPDDLRRHISVMFQDFMQYEAPAGENIGFGRVERVRDRPGIRRAAERAGAASFLDGSPAVSTPRWAAGSREGGNSPVGNGRRWRSPGRSSEQPRSTSWTSPPRRSMPPPRRRSSSAWPTPPAGPPHCSSRTDSPPYARPPTTSRSSTVGASSKRAAIPH